MNSPGGGCIASKGGREVPDEAGSSIARAKPKLSLWKKTENLRPETTELPSTRVTENLRPPQMAKKKGQSSSILLRGRRSISGGNYRWPQARKKPELSLFRDTKKMRSSQVVQLRGQSPNSLCEEGPRICPRCHRGRTRRNWDYSAVFVYGHGESEATAGCLRARAKLELSLRHNNGAKALDVFVEGDRELEVAVSEDEAWAVFL